MAKRIRAKEARIKYFEDYILFEQTIRKIARENIDLYSTAHKSLKTIIMDLGVVNGTKSLQLPMRSIRTQRLVRNWLAHQPKNSLAGVKKMEFMESIKALNKKLISF